MNSDFRDLLSTFSSEGVEYLVVGAHAVVHYSQPRYTKDIDIWVRPSEDNSLRTFKALSRFGAPLRDLSPADFADPDTVYMMGVPPSRIDVLMGIDGVSFEEAWPRRIVIEYGGIPVFLIGKEDLIANKRATALAQDLLDLERLLEG